MHKLLTALMILMISLSYAQVGINTEDPQATLEIAVDPARNNEDGSVGTPGYLNGGMILGYPGKKNNYISSFDVQGIQELQQQEILMRNKTTGQVDYMDRYAIDYFPARPSHIAPIPTFPAVEYPINEQDHTILVRGDITLPPGDNYIGKTLYLIYDSQTERPVKVNGPMKYNAYLSQNLTEGIYLSRVNSGYVVQYDGTKWFVVGGFEQEDNEKVELVTLYDGDTAQVRDNKILVKGDINLPTATVAGFELTLTYNGDGTETFMVTGNIDDSGTTSTSFTMSTASNQRAIKLQSNGTNWVVLAKR